MQKKIENIINLIKEKDIKMVDFKMVDINGQYRHVTFNCSASISDSVLIIFTFSSLR